MSNDSMDAWNTGPSGNNNSGNINSSMLNLNDDYTNILNNLANGHSSSLNDAFQDRQDHQTAQHNLPNLNDKAQTDKQPNLNMLLQHYQDLLSRSASNDNSPDFSGAPTPIMNTKTIAAQENKSVIADKPCDHCRRRQIKCVIVPDLPNCVQCETKGIKCVYSELPSSRTATELVQDQQKRGRVDENVNVHELLKRAKLSNNDSVSQYYSELLQNLNQNSGNMNSSEFSHVNSGSTKGNSPLLYGTPGYNNNASPSNVSGLTNFNTGNGVNQKPAYAQPPIQYPRSSFYVGPTSVFDINLVNHVKLDKIDQVQLSKTLALRKVAPNVQFILRDDFNQGLYLKQEQEIDLVEKLVHPHGKILVDIFFKLVHPYFPILHERVFLEKYSRSYRELTAPLLAAIYSLSLQWWDFHPQLVGFPKPDVTEQLNEIALRTFFDVVERPKLSIIQTGLLILQCRSECSSNWVICSEVVALAEDLGLGVDCQDWRLPRWERGLRRRLAWAVWLQDKWTSMMEARYSHLILGRNWLVKMLTEEDFPDKSPVISSSQSTSQGHGQLGNDVSGGNISMLDMSPTDEDFNNGKLMFQQMVSLSIILGEVLDTFYTLGALKTVTKIEQVLKLAKPLQLKMREWYHSLPSQLSMNTFQQRKFNSNAALTLSYFAVEITLHRKIITTLKPDTARELVQVCRTAAKTRLIAAIEFARDLKFEHINSFWYTCSTGNLTLIGTFAALLYVTAPTKEEAIVFRDCLRNYVWILRMTSKSFDKAGNSLKRIHMLLTQIPGLLTDEPVIPHQPQQSFMPPPSQSPMMSQHSLVQPQTVVSNSSDQSPFHQQTPLNHVKNIPPDVLQQLVSLQGNMPSLPGALNQVAGGMSPVNRDLESNGVQKDSVKNADHSDRGQTSPMRQAQDTKASPQKTSQQAMEESSFTQVRLQESSQKGQNSPGKASSLSNKPKPLTPQSVNGVTGKNINQQPSKDNSDESQLKKENANVNVSPVSSLESSNSGHQGEDHSSPKLSSLGTSESKEVKVNSESPTKTSEGESRQSTSDND